MKRILIAALIFCVSVSCKKGGAPAPKEKLLSSIYEDDKLQYSFEYSSDKKLKKVRKFHNASLTPTYEDAYTYDANGFLKEKLRVVSLAKTRYIYECNNAGMVIKISQIPLTGADSGKVTQWSTYTYNGSNQLIKINYYLDEDTPEGYQTLEYAGNGGLANHKSYVEKLGGSVLLVYWKFNGASNRVNPGMRKAFIEPDKTEFMLLDAKTIDVTIYSNGLTQTIHNYAMSDRASDGPGLLTKQTITSKQTFPAASIPAAKAMRYEYVEM